MQRSILIIEDDPDLARLASLHLADHGFRVDVEPDGARGCELALTGEHDLLLVDLMLPGTDGLEICRRVRAGERYTPILILTARGSEVDRVLGLEVGADDYLTKPFSFPELVARVRAIFRRIDALAGTPDRAGERIQRGELSIDPVRRTVRLGEDRIDLTAKEYDLLEHFAANPGRVYTRSDLVEAIWGPGYEGYEHTVNSHINRLRGKINCGGPRQRFIQTVWGVGYRFAEGEGS
ncbi:MAG: response regulator transcription factor [Planctomycetota bacterium]